jgi:tetratricopeptide (TPR) repeat protein
MARLYDRQKDSAKAIEFYRKVNAAAPNNADAYAELGGVYARAGDLKSAKNELQKAVNLQPQNRGYRASMAGVLLDSGNVDAAFEELRQTDSPATAHYQMACLHFNRKNIPATQQQLQMALQIDPNLKPARDLLASMGGAQNISNMVQQGQQFGQQAMGIYQQTGALVQGASASLSGSVPASPSPVGAAPALPSIVTP